LNVRIIDFFHACQDLDLSIVVFNEIYINGGSRGKRDLDLTV